MIDRKKRARLSLGDRLTLATYGARASWPTGFQIYQRNAPADGVFIVLSGHIILRSKIKAGRGFIAAIVSSGETFGAEGLISSGNNLSTSNAQYVTDASANEESETLFLSGERFRAFVREQPAQAISLISQIMSERSSLLEKLHELAALNVEDRLVSTLLRLSSDRAFTGEDGRVRLAPGHHRLLCEMVGATRESIALALGKLVSSGAAERKGMSFSVSPAQLLTRSSSGGSGAEIEADLPVSRELHIAH